MRASPSCLELESGHLVCGSREGHVRLWRSKAAAKSAKPQPFARRFGVLGEDCGPVQAVMLTTDLLVAAYAPRPRLT